MKNIIKADMYRMLRGKGLYITFGILIVFIVLQTVALGSVGTVGVMIMTEETSTLVSYENEDGSVSTVYTEPESEIFNGETAPFSMMGTTDNLLFFVLAFIIFIGATDFSEGCAKNVLSNGMPRVKYYLAKLILSCAFCIPVLLFNVILPIITATVMNGFGGTLDLAFIGSIIRPFLAQLFLCLAVTFVGVFFVFLTKKTAAVNGAFIAFYFIPLMIAMLLPTIIPELKFLADYEIISNIRSIANIDTAAQTEIIRAFIIGGFFMTASTVAGLLIFKKSEIK